MTLTATWRVDGGWVGTPVQGWPFLAPLLPFYNVLTNRMQDTEALCPHLSWAKFIFPVKEKPHFPKLRKMHYYIPKEFPAASGWYMVGIYFLRFCTADTATCNILLGSNKENREKFNGKAGKHALHTVLGRNKRNYCKALNLIISISVKE